jgi:hypothetical protein
MLIELALELFVIDAVIKCSLGDDACNEGNDNNSLADKQAIKRNNLKK